MTNPPRFCANYSPAAAAPTAQTAGVTIIFQEGVEITVDGAGTGVTYASTQDTYTDGSWNNVNNVLMCVIGGARVGLMRFEDIFGPGAGQIPFGPSIQAASLNLALVYSASWPTSNTNFGQLNPSQTWTESSPVTQSNFSDGNGIQYGSDAIALGLFENDVTSSLSAWVSDPDLNNGWVFTSGGNNRCFASSDNGTVSYRPKLMVTFTVPTPAEQIQNLVDTVNELNLQNGITNSLDAKLDAASQALDDLNDNNNIAAINSLQAFINAVDAQRSKEYAAQV